MIRYKRTIFILILILYCSVQTAYADDWYTQGKFKPSVRYKLTLKNTLDFDRTNCPIILPREQMPIQDLHELWVTVVDPSLPPSPKPSKEILAKFGTHQLRQETNGHAIFHQLDDLDKDGVWDELFFMTDIKAHETKNIYVYTGYNQRGWNKHGTHAGIGSYCRHLVAFWESEHVGWKLWYPTDCDVYGKRKSQLMAHRLYMENLDGYGVPFDLGSDIMSVSNSFGGGGICLFEHPEHPDSVSRPRYSLEMKRQGYRKNFNTGQIRDTRYAFDVVVNGPVRSIIKAKTMNWNTDVGFYELEQVYTAYTNQNYSTCTVRFNKFLPEKSGTMFGCGIRKKPREDTFYQEGGIIITSGSEEIRNPDDVEGLQKLIVEFVGTALIVKGEYKPEYQFVSSFKGNHTFKIPLREDNTYEYLIAAAWSEGEVLKTSDEFKEYILKTAQEYNNPIIAQINKKEIKPQ